MFSLLYKLKLKKARKTRREAIEAWCVARERGDTRTQRSTMLGLAKATATVLALESGRRPA